MSRRWLCFLGLHEWSCFYLLEIWHQRRPESKDSFDVNILGRQCLCCGKREHVSLTIRRPPRRPWDGQLVKEHW